MYSLPKFDNYSVDDFESVWSSELSRLNPRSIENYKNMTSLDYLKHIAHQVEDIVLRYELREYSALSTEALSCQWPTGAKCDHDDFEWLLSDFGVCYTINANSTNFVTVTQAGISSTVMNKSVYVA